MSGPCWVLPAERGSVFEPVSAPPLFVGTVEIAVGVCSLTRSGAVAVQIKSGDHVCEGDVIDTAEDSRICIRLIDGTIFSLSSNASAVLNRFALDVSAPSATVHVSRGNFALVAGAIAKAGRFEIETPVASIRSRLLPSGLGLMSFAALFLTTMDEIHAAGSGIAFLDDGTITYKDLEHGIFELVTKELNPRHIFVDDPGETIVLRQIGSSISESHIANSFAQMAQFEAAQQEALHIFSLGLQGPTATGTGGSSTPPSFQFPTFVQPINFTQPDNSSQHFTILDNVGAGGHSPPPQDLFLLPPPPPAPPGSVVEIPNATGQTTEDSTTGTLALGGESFSQSAPTFAWSAGALNEDQQTTLVHASTLTVTPSGNGTANVSFSAPDDTFDFLAAGETLTITYEVTGNGTPSTQPVTITIIGTNDAPKLDAETSGSHQFTELADKTGDATDPHGTSGTLQFTDPDLNDTHTVTSANVASIDWSADRQLPEGLENELSQAFSATAHDNEGTGTGSVDFTFSAPDRDFDFLAEGESLKVTYDVTVTDNHGVSSTQPVTVTVYGSEDKPIILSGDQSGSIFEDADNDQNENNESHVASGTIQFRDVDLTDAETSSYTIKTISPHLNGYVLTDDQTNALLNAFTIDTTTPDHSAVDGTGEINWQYTIDDKALDFLGADDDVTLTYTVKVSDGHGGYASQDVTITVHGAEDAPVIASGTQSGSVIEDDDKSIGENNETHHQSGTITFNDVDLSDQEAASFVDPAPLVSATLANGALTDDQTNKLVGAFTLDTLTPEHSSPDGTGNLTWHYDIADKDIDFLGAQDQVTLTYTVKLNDGHGGYVSQDVVITVQGTEDVPVVSATSDSFSEGSGTNVQDLHEASGTISFTDSDLSDRPTVTAAFDSFSYTDAHGAEITQLSDAQRDAIDALEMHLQPLVPQYGNTNDGSAAWTYSVADSALDFLAQGETLTLKYTATVDDHQTGGTVATPFTITITGTNDAPTIAATDDSIWEQSGTNNSGDDIASGQITFADVDLTDRPTVTATFTDYTDSGDRILTVGQKAALETMLALGPTPDTNDGSLAWTYTVPDKALDFLAQDETLTLTYTAKVDDGNGGTASQPLTVTIHGTNDAPVLQLTGAYILDQFNTQDYGAWVEQHDDFRAQNGSPTEGDFQIAHDPKTADGDLQIKLTDLDAEVGPPDLLSRTFDLSDATSATLTFDYRRDIPNGDVDDKFFVFVSKDGGTPVEIDQIGATGSGSFVDDHYNHETITLDSSLLSSGTTITFSVGDDVDNGDVVYVDNIKIAYDTAQTDPLVVNYAENSAVGVAGKITDVDGDTITSAAFTLTDHRAGDLLSVIGTLPDHITSQYDADNGILTLTGQASLTDYEAALQQVVFSNTSDNPDTADRHLTVTVNDGFNDSEVTTTTIHVTAIDDAPVAMNDNIITNASFTNFQIPVSALLANDSDPDNSPDQLSITHVSVDSDDGASLSSGFITFSHFDDGSFDYTVSDPDSLSDTGHVTVSKQSGNTLNGSSVSEILIGNSEANTLNGGGGADILIGNGGNDTFVFKSVTDSQPGAGHYNTINDFAAAADHIDLTAITGATNIQDLAQGNTVAAHSVGWLVDSAHDQTIVYVNTTDTAETPGHTDMEIHLVGTNIDLSNAFLLHHS